jgi:hypothetical protein
MTMAVCFRCGAIKFGAFCPCPECQALPISEDDLALSLAMTDHYFDVPTLEQMGAAVRDGNLPQLDPETRANLLADLRRFGLAAKLNRIMSGEDPGRVTGPDPPSPATN